MTRRWPSTIASVFPLGGVTADGHALVKVASRFGTLHWVRPVVCHPDSQEHVRPGNAVLPAHEGMIITRGLPEWACLLPQELPLASVRRRLGWPASQEQLVCPSTVPNLVRAHGRLIRPAEQAEVAALLKHPQSSLKPQLVPHGVSRRRAGWPEELNAAVEAGLEAEAVQPPKGVSAADWERVLAAPRPEALPSATDLRRLGPELAEEQVLASADEVLTRKPEKRRFWELRTARVATTAGYRYLSGVGESFLHQGFVLLLIWGVGGHRSRLVMADGARWIGNFSTGLLAKIPHKPMILDGYPLHPKGYQLGRMICRGRKAKTQFLATLYRRLGPGELMGAMAFLEAYRPQAKNEGKLDELILYLPPRQAFIPNYQQPRRERRYIGSAHAEKANDLMVARRQKNKGRHWSQDTSDALAALKTLMLNGGWDLYWHSRHVLPWVAT